MEIRDLYDDEMDWGEAFAVATTDIRPAPPDSNVSLLSPTRDDVANIFAAAEGANDGDEWLIHGRLLDGRYFFLSAGCDYTGWDCQAGGHMFVSNNPVDLIRFGMDNDERGRLLLTDISTAIATTETASCPECGLDLIHAVDCSRRVEPPAETPIAAAPSIETPEPEPQTTFLFTCNDGSQYEIPSGHPDLSIGGFMDADGESRGAEYVMHDPQLMPVHFQQYYLAGSRQIEPTAEPEVVENKRSGKKAKRTLKKIRKALKQVDSSYSGYVKTCRSVKYLVEKYYS